MIARSRRATLGLAAAHATNSFEGLQLTLDPSRDPRTAASFSCSIAFDRPSEDTTGESLRATGR
jgi:hypothetical protein